MIAQRNCTHFLIACKATDNLKAYFLPKVLDDDDVELFMKLISNPSSDMYGLGRNNAEEVELLSRNRIFERHNFRARAYIIGGKIGF